MDHEISRPALSPAERKELRALAHHLKPVVMIGDGGLTDAVVAEAERALSAHELIKVRVHGDDRESRLAWLEQLCDRLGAAPVQAIGKLLVLWRPAPDPDDPFSAAARKGKPSGPAVPKKRLEARSEQRGQAKAAGRTAPLAPKGVRKAAAGDTLTTASPSARRAAAGTSPARPGAGAKVGSVGRSKTAEGGRAASGSGTRGSGTGTRTKSGAGGWTVSVGKAARPTTRGAKKPAAKVAGPKATARNSGPRTADGAKRASARTRTAPAGTVSREAGAGRVTSAARPGGLGRLKPAGGGSKGGKG